MEVLELKSEECSEYLAAARDRQPHPRLGVEDSPRERSKPHPAADYRTRDHRRAAPCGWDRTLRWQLLRVGHEKWKTNRTRG